MSDKKESKLTIEIGLEKTNLGLTGSANECLGFISRARLELDILENRVKVDILKEGDKS